MTGGRDKFCLLALLGFLFGDITKDYDNAITGFILTDRRRDNRHQYSLVRAGQHHQFVGVGWFVKTKCLDNRVVRGARLAAITVDELDNTLPVEPQGITALPADDLLGGWVDELDCAVLGDR